MIINLKCVNCNRIVSVSTDNLTRLVCQSCDSIQFISEMDIELKCNKCGMGRAFIKGTILTASHKCESERSLMVRIEPHGPITKPKFIDEFKLDKINEIKTEEVKKEPEKKTDIARVKR